jgi:hypothetical protein
MGGSAYSNANDATAAEHTNEAEYDVVHSPGGGNPSTGNEALYAIPMEGADDGVLPVNEVERGAIDAAGYLQVDGRSGLVVGVSGANYECAPSHRSPSFASASRAHGMSPLVAPTPPIPPMPPTLSRASTPLATPTTTVWVGAGAPSTAATPTSNVGNSNINSSSSTNNLISSKNNSTNSSHAAGVDAANPFGSAPHIPTHLHHQHRLSVNAAGTGVRCSFLTMDSAVLGLAPLG